MGGLEKVTQIPIKYNQGTQNAISDRTTHPAWKKSLDFSWWGSELKNMKAWIHPDLDHRFRSMLVA